MLSMRLPRVWEPIAWDIRKKLCSFIGSRGKQIKLQERLRNTPIISQPPCPGRAERSASRVPHLGHLASRFGFREIFCLKISAKHFKLVTQLNQLERLDSKIRPNMIKKFYELYGRTISEARFGRYRQRYPCHVNLRIIRSR